MSIVYYIYIYTPNTGTDPSLQNQCCTVALASVGCARRTQDAVPAHGRTVHGGPLASSLPFCRFCAWNCDEVSHILGFSQEKAPGLGVEGRRVVDFRRTSLPQCRLPLDPERPSRSP